MSCERYTKRLFCLGLLGVMAGLRAGACDSGTVRMASFSEPREVHKLCVIANAGDAAGDALHARLETALAGYGAELNLELVRVKADDPALDWRALALPSVPPSLPVTVLVGLDSVQRRPFLIDHWEPAPTDDDLAALLGSPVREAVKREVAAHWAVLLYARGAGADAGATESVVRDAAKRWAEKQPPGVAVVPLDRTDPKERLLRAFIGLAAAGPDWVGVVFGRGKLMAPPLEGTAITEANLDRLIGLLLQPCTCLQAGTSLGVDIPMVWAEALDATVVALGEDAYLETGPVVAAAAPAVPAAPNAAPAPASRVSVTALIVLGASVLVVVLATGGVLWRGRTRIAAPTSE